MDIPDIPPGTTKAEAALIYARAGIPVFPCGSNKEPITKLAPNGFYSQTTDEETITRWWDERPDANPASAFDSHTLILDVDDTTKAKSVTDLLSKTGPVQTTGGATKWNPKHHRLYDTNGHDIGLTRIPELGIETKGLLKGYILLAPSTTSGTYQWQRTGAPEPLPDSLYRTLTAKRPKTPSTAPNGARTVITVSAGPCANWCDRADPITRDPGGHQHLNDFAFHRVTYHRDTQKVFLEEQLLPLLSRMDPPYSNAEGIAEVEKVVTQMMADIANGKVSPDDPWTNGETNVEDNVSDGLIYASEAKPDPNYTQNFLVDRLLIPGAFHVFAAPEGLGKTRVRVELGMRLAIGHGAFLGHFQVLHQAKVLIFDEDQGPEMETQVEEQVLAGLGLTRADLGQHYARYSLLGLDLTTETDRRRLSARIEAFVPDVVILDTGSTMVGEEWGEALKGVVKFVLALTQTYGCAVLVLVHMVKPVRGDKRPHGGDLSRRLDEVMGHWPKFATGVWVMSGAAGDDRAIFQTFKRFPTKSRLVLEQRDDIWTVVKDLTGLPPAGLVLKPNSTDDRVLRAIHDRLDLTPEVTGVRDTVRADAIKRLRGMGLLGLGFPYEVTESGLVAIGVVAEDADDDSGLTPASTPVVEALSTQDSGQ